MRRAPYGFPLEKDFCLDMLGVYLDTRTARVTPSRLTMPICEDMQAP